MANPARRTDRRLICAGAALWIVGPVTYLVFEGVAAAAFAPAYSYAQNYISDLGITVNGMSSGRIVDSPRAAWANSAFCVQGVSFLAGAVLIVRGLRSRRPWPFLALAAANAVGNVLVATVHSGPPAGAGGPTWLHPTGAVLAIVGGNAAIFAGSQLVSDGGCAVYRTVSTSVGAVGLLSLLMLKIDSASSSINIAGNGVWERGSVSSILGWQLLTGCALLSGRLGRSRR